MFINFIKYFSKHINLEAVMWVLGILYLGLIDPGNSENLNLCFFKFIGIENCPGCGIGTSISYLLHGDYLKSFVTHPLGIPAAIILASRIFYLLYKSFRKKESVHLITN